MIIIPAIDIKDGKCVRLLQGDMDKETIFSDSPSAMAKKWEDKGAQRLHIVDLNGAVSGAPKNFKYVKDIISSVRIPVQIGGGIRNRETVETYLSLGTAKIILGTAAIADFSFVKKICKQYPDRILIGLDARNEMVCGQGWTETTDKSAAEFVKEFEGIGAAGIIYTDINRDGMMKGPNIESIKRIAEMVEIPITASGGITCIEDIKNIMSLEKYGVEGMIIGRALYTGTISLKEAIRVAGCGFKITLTRNP